MWKMLVGFVVFAAIVVFVLMKSDANIDMGGEKHGIDAGEPHDAVPATSATTPSSPIAAQLKAPIASAAAAAALMASAPMPE